MPEGTKKEPRAPLKKALTGATGRRSRMDTQVSIRKARKEDGYNQRRNLAAQAKAQAENRPQERSLLIEQLASRSQTLLVGLQHPDKEVRRKSLRAFVYLMSSGVPPLFDDGDPQHVPLWHTITTAVPFFVSTLDLPDVPMQSDAAFALRFISSMDRSNLVIEGGALPKLAVLLQCGISELQIQAAWCLGNVASESKACCEAVVHICPPIQVIPHIRLSTPSLRRAAVWLLRSMIDMTDLLATMQVLTPQFELELVTVLGNVIKQLVQERAKLWAKDKDKAVPSAAPWRLFEFQTGKPAPNDIAVVRLLRDIDDTTVEVVDVDVNFETGENVTFRAARSTLRPLQAIEDVFDEDGDDEDASSAQDAETLSLDERALTLCDSTWAVVEVTQHNVAVLAVLQSTGVFAKLVEALHMYSSPLVLSPVLRLLGYVISHDEAYVQVVLDAGLLAACPRVLQNSSRSIREEACWLLSNLAGGTVQHMTAVLEAPGVVTSVVEQLTWAEYSVKREAGWAVCNLLVNANAVVAAELVRLDVLSSLSTLLDEYEDPSLELVILEAISAVLDKGHDEAKVAVEESGCLKCVENLCYAANEQVSAAASHIIDTWFDGVLDDDVDAELAPAAVDEATNTLAFQPATTPFQFGGQ
ncbi:hypothetical protein DYB30_005574 [Aphanomyces astaci]|uniref:IBB domain-containing protein n=1 Tax=Aphanomyces astaci TaxID=112090 RepID=A0A397EGK3_APHAT|nr:hypothetical protein DYB38_007418 [Aphanomyces astaci]RHY50586.1 hypothetical protein DYB30_005574 [Aphanomyces astaci]RHY78776.1 hypothetical protein DYB31_004089 [Aphanomyces astaci]RHZ42062.1 hypothetical protein DYB26_006323 [Aphanomyces astaci]